MTYYLNLVRLLAIKEGTGVLPPIPVAFSQFGVEKKMLTTTLAHSPLTCEGSASTAGDTAGTTVLPQAIATNHRCLMSGVDALTITAGGPVAPSKYLLDNYQEWISLQQQYESGDDPIIVQMNEVSWVLKPYGSQPYRFCLENKEIAYIQCWNPEKWSGAAQKKQNIHIRFRAKFIHSFSYADLRKQIDNIVSCFFETLDGVSIQVSRIDLHSDITHSRMLTFEEVSSSISRSKVRWSHFADTKEVVFTKEEQEMLAGGLSNNKSPQKIQDINIDSFLEKVRVLYENQNSNNLSSVIKKKDLETAYFGKIGSAIWGKIYDKTKEVIKTQNSDTPELWKQAGWDGNQVVVRVEFSLNREFIKQLNNGIYVDIDNIFDGLDDIWSYLCNHWLRLVEEVNINHSTQSRITHFWNVVISSFSSSNKQIIRKKSYVARLKALFNQSLGCMRQMVSIGMSDDYDISYVNAAISDFNSNLMNDFSSGEYVKRRRVLGLI